MCYLCVAKLLSHKNKTETKQQNSAFIITFLAILGWHLPSLLTPNTLMIVLNGKHVFAKTEKIESCHQCQLSRHLAAPQFVKTTTCGATIDDQVSIMKILYWFSVEAFIKTFIWHLLLDCTNLLVSRPGWGCVRKVGKVEGFPQPSALATLGALGPLESHRDLGVTRTAPLSVPEGGSGNRCSDASWCVSPVARKRSNCAKVPSLLLLVALLWQWTHPQWWRHRLAS